jgi:uncharacterized membrane protein
MRMDANTGRNEQYHPGLTLLALLLATGASVALVICRVWSSKRAGYLILVWNLFLAWAPLVFALGVCREHRAGQPRRWRLWTLSGLWLLFFPNAPYIFTDLVHLNRWFYAHYWPDMIVILLVALTGFLVGFVSLYLMQSVVAERVGRARGWLFILMVAGLSGLGVYIGRFLRWNSWDVFLHPVGLSVDLGRLAAHPAANTRSFVFQGLFATFVLFGYLMLYALTHLPRWERQAAVV